MTTTKTLQTGLVIHYNKKGNIKYIESPFYSEKKNNPLRGGILRYYSHIIKEMIK